MTRALVIDDDANVGAAIRAILASQRIDTVLALRAHAGIYELELSEFDVVLVDLFMPGMGGLDTIEKIRNRAPTIPIVAMTGFRFRESTGTGADFLSMAVERGATAAIRKPFAAQRLIDVINTSLATLRDAILPDAAGLPLCR